MLTAQMVHHALSRDRILLHKVQQLQFHLQLHFAEHFELIRSVTCTNLGLPARAWSYLCRSLEYVYNQSSNLHPFQPHQVDQVPGCHCKSQLHRKPYCLGKHKHQCLQRRASLYTIPRTRCALLTGSLRETLVGDHGGLRIKGPYTSYHTVTLNQGP